MFRSLHHCERTPIILLSVDDDPHTRALAAQLGIDIFLPHPVELVRLHHALFTAVERALTPRPKVAVLRDPDAASVIEGAGLHCMLFFSLEELLRELDVQGPDLVLLGSTVTAKQVPAIVRMSAWDADCALLCFDDSPLAKEPAVPSRRVKWMAAIGSAVFAGVYGWLWSMSVPPSALAAYLPSPATMLYLTLPLLMVFGPGFWMLLIRYGVRCFGHPRLISLAVGLNMIAMTLAWLAMAVITIFRFRPS